MNPWPPARSRFKPGQSGNPGGRPKGISRALRKAATYSPKVIDVLAAIAFDESHPVTARIAASSIILDRGMGKPQPAEVEQPAPLPFFQPQPMTPEQRALAVAMVKSLPEDGSGAGHLE